MKTKLFISAAIVAFLLLWTPGYSVLALDHSGTLGTDETWSPADNPHNIIGNLTVPAGIKLTIQPGVQIFFTGYYSITVAGEMAADGTVGAPIIFTRAVETDNWNNLLFQTNGTGSLTYCLFEYAYYGVTLGTNSACTIDHCTIQLANYYGIYWYAPATNPGHVITNNLIRNCRSLGVYVSNVSNALIGSGNQVVDNGAGIYFSSCASPQVAAQNTIARHLSYGVQFQNCDQPLLLSDVSESGIGVIYKTCTGVGTIADLAFTGNTEAAIQVQGCGAFSLGGGNTITANGSPLAIDAGSFPDAASQIPTSGNLVNAIRVVAGSGSQTGTWHKFTGLDYWLAGSATIAADGDLTIEPGTTFKCGAFSGITVAGKLSLAGTAEAPIRMTRIGADYWNGLRFNSTSEGVVQHVDIEHASYGLFQNQTAIVPISKCRFRQCTYGVYIAGGTTGQVTGSEFFYNDYGIYLAPGATATVGGSGENLCCFKGNRTWALFNQNAGSIKAEFNYWGDPAGPNHLSHPAGRGDRVSDSVDFIPYAWVCANACECDLNQNGSCNILDYQLFIQDWGRTDCGTPPGTGNPPNDCECDINLDGSCNILDYQIFIQDWGRTDCPMIQ